MRTTIFWVTTVILLMFFCVPWRTALVLVNVKDNSIYAMYPVRENEEFSIIYTHSVHKRPVTEFFRVKQGQLEVYKTQFDTFGVGIPHEISEQESISESNGVVTIDNINRVLREGFILRVGTIANHRLQIKDRVLPLNQMFQPGDPVLFQLRRVSAIQLSYWRRP
jgi:hypothetical protein